MIKWTPDDGGTWQPQNFVNVINYGVEAILKTQLQYKKHQLNVSGTYAYTKAIDQQTDKQLIYVPLQKINANITYTFKKIEVFAETTFTDEVFTNGNNTNILTGYAVSNTGISFQTQVHNTRSKS
jgi:iron complex outermembrane receptor protein